MALASICFVPFFVTISAAHLVNNYRAAVYEHRVVHNLPNVPVWEMIETNLFIYEQQAREALNQGAQILVFPEDGILGNKHSRDSIRPFLQRMPDPKITEWSPCEYPMLYGSNPILYRLSCIAKRNQMYIVANIGELQPCSRSSDPNCPEEGNYQFNTNVAFDRTGVLLAKYRKCHLYNEPEFDTPVPCEAQTFETDFVGTFGLFTCFDMLFQSPAVDLVHQGVKNFAFPTAWMDSLPLMSAVATQMGWSVGYDVNVLAANLHNPSGRFQGSGIYSGRRAPPVFYYDETEDASRLIVATVTTSTLADEATHPTPHVSQSIVSDVLSLQINGDMHNAVCLLPTQDSARVCYKDLCCRASYRMSAAPETFILGAFSDMHKDRFMQVCVIAKCSNSSSSACGRVIEASTLFSYLDLSGNFTTKNVLPSVSLDGVYLADLSEWTYSEDPRIYSSTGFSRPLLAATILGRWFERD